MLSKRLVAAACRSHARITHPQQLPQRINVYSVDARRQLSSDKGTAPNTGTAGTDPVQHLPVKSMCIGMTAGCIGSLVGLGGGFIAIPLMTGWLKLPQHHANGTSLCAVIATGTFGCAGYLLAGHVDLVAAAAIAVTATVTAGMGARLTQRISERTLKRMLGIFLILCAPLVPLKGYFLAQTVEGTDGESSDSTNPAVLAQLAALGAGAGVLAGVFGVGGGTVLVPSLVLLTDLNYYQVLGTSLAAMVLPALSGAVQHARQGNVRVRVALPLTVGTAMGAYVGASWVVQHVDQDVLKWVFTALTLVLGGRTVIKAG